MHASEIVNELDNVLSNSPYVRPGGSLLLMVGLPGAGKSFLVDCLSKLVPCVIIRTDQVRLYIRQEPTYTAAEMMYTYEICYQVVAARLEKGQRVVFDASNYLAARRQRLMAIARRKQAAITVCQVEASEAVTRERLARRANGLRSVTDWSDAGWSVYKWMAEAQEPVAVEHLKLDTSETDVKTLAEQLHRYWITRESEFEGNHNLQSGGRPGGYGDAY